MEQENIPQQENLISIIRQYVREMIATDELYTRISNEIDDWQRIHSPTWVMDASELRIADLKITMTRRMKAYIRYKMGS